MRWSMFCQQDRLKTSKTSDVLSNQNSPPGLALRGWMLFGDLKLQGWHGMGALDGMFWKNSRTSCRSPEPPGPELCDSRTGAVAFLLSQFTNYLKGFSLFKSGSLYVAAWYTYCYLISYPSFPNQLHPGPGGFAKAVPQASHGCLAAEKAEGSPRTGPVERSRTPKGIDAGSSALNCQYPPAMHVTISQRLHGTGIFAYIGPKPPQCRHIWQSHGASGCCIILLNQENPRANCSDPKGRTNTPCQPLRPRVCRKCKNIYTI